MAYRRTLETEKIIKRIEEFDDNADFLRIRCPLCKWSPEKTSRWICADADAPEFFYKSCGTSWNTFETRGKCPTCAHQWIWTSCLRCFEWSKHEDWYEKLNENARR